MFVDKANELLPKLRGEAMTLAEQFEQAGHERGLQQGLEQGQKKGLTCAKLEIAGNMLADGMAIDKIAEFTGLMRKEIAKLKAIKNQEIIH
jgi:predicted transposase/invertase (TIGR01784 family)